MRIGIDIFAAERLYEGSHRAVLDLAAEADRRGVDILTTSDHLGFTGDSHAVRRREHAFPFDLDQTWPEPLSWLSTVAAVTERIELGVFVLVAPLRPAVLLAKQIATLDVLSGGRCHIGVGAGWQEAEYEAAGIPFRRRFGRLEETVAACRALWGPQPATFSGETAEFTDFYCLPRPVQERVPLMFGVAPSRRNFERIARVGDGWAAAPADVDQLAESVDLLRRCFSEHGRDPDSAEVQMLLPVVEDRSGNVDYTATSTAAKEAVSAGVDTILVRAASFARSTRDIDPLFDWLTDLKAQNS